MGNLDFETPLSFARAQDEADPLKGYKAHFFKPEAAYYIEANGLGLACKEAKQTLNRVAEEWARFGVGGWMQGDPAWFFYPEKLAGAQAPLVGAKPEELILAGTTTTNIHSALATFYRPTKTKYKILIDELNFPSDRYAVESQLALKGQNPKKALAVAKSRNGWTLEEDDLIAAMTEDVQLAFFPSVLHQSGQLLDIEKLGRAAAERGIVIGFDLSHSVGVVPHNLTAAAADFAVWCNYKYLNGGPGCPASLYINEKHFGETPGLAGWHGYNKNRQFSMLPSFEAAGTAGGWQHGSPHILNMAPLEGAQSLVLSAGVLPMREKSLALTGFFLKLAAEWLMPLGAVLATPQREERRGGQVTFVHPAGGVINEALESGFAEKAELYAAYKKENKPKGELAQYTRADMVRISFSPLYSSFEEVYRLARALFEFMEKAGR